MIIKWISRPGTLAAAAIAALVSFAAAGSLGSAQPRAAHLARPDLDPAYVTYKLPSQIQWSGRPGVAETAVLLGDPTKEGLYIELVKWYPHNNSRPHFHPNDRYITVLSGTWWVGSGRKYDPDSMVAMPAGSYVVDLAKQPHYDGAKDQTAVIEIVGQGPATITPDEQK
jgi:quercetin dioxygenase-like cupin family protein